MANNKIRVKTLSGDRIEVLCREHEAQTGSIIDANAQFCHFPYIFKVVGKSEDKCTYCK